MERSLHHETTLGREREKAKLAEKELFKLKNWKLMMEQKLKLAEQARDEFHKLTEKLKKTLEDKEKEVRQAKQVAVLEYRDSDALIAELGVSYNNSFDDALRQVKALYPKLDFSSVNISVPEPTSIHPEQSKDTMQVEEIFSNHHLLCMNIFRTIMFCPSCFGLCRHFYFFAYLLELY